ncbi:hypothetical protein BJ508DRAFT_332426 [Ascobolus immersus RN42]|uniref:Uncharacterized protein n=1 Tax=Ascobolus immersus RN42 TaxID=1160509 RepID=A0A3N4HMU2_ASCIM|nr:hypothetical protein BJ508DRAFT_332426 [Ascobolus immersus RN42]
MNQRKQRCIDASMVETCKVVTNSKEEFAMGNSEPAVEDLNLVEGRKAQIVASCSAASSEPNDDLLLPDLLLFKKTLHDQPNILEQPWILAVDALDEENRMSGILHGQPDKKRLQIMAEFIANGITDSKPLLKVEANDLRQETPKKVSQVDNESGSNIDVMILGFAVYMAEELAAPSVST